MNSDYSKHILMSKCVYYIQVYIKKCSWPASCFFIRSYIKSWQVVHRTHFDIFLSFMFDMNGFICWLKSSSSWWIIILSHSFSRTSQKQCCQLLYNDLFLLIFNLLRLKKVVNSLVFWEIFLNIIFINLHCETLGYHEIIVIFTNFWIQNCYSVKKMQATDLIPKYMTNHLA